MNGLYTWSYLIHQFYRQGGRGDEEGTRLAQGHTQLEGSCQDCTQFSGFPKPRSYPQTALCPSNNLVDLVQSHSHSPLVPSALVRVGPEAWEVPFLKLHPCLLTVFFLMYKMVCLTWALLCCLIWGWGLAGSLYSALLLMEAVVVFPNGHQQKEQET